MPGSCRTYMTTILDAIDFLSQRARPRFAATPVLTSGMGQFHNLQRRLAMVRERNVQRRLGARGLTAMVLLAAIALPLGAKFARADDPTPGPTRPASMPHAAKDPTDAAPGATAVATDCCTCSRVGAVLPTRVVVLGRSTSPRSRTVVAGVGTATVPAVPAAEAEISA